MNQTAVPKTSEQMALEALQKVKLPPGDRFLCEDDAVALLKAVCKGDVRGVCFVPVAQEQINQQGCALRQLNQLLGRNPGERTDTIHVALKELMEASLARIIELEQQLGIDPEEPSEPKEPSSFAGNSFILESAPVACCAVQSGPDD